MKSELSHDLMYPDNNDPQSLARLEKPDMLALKRSFSCPRELHYPLENSIDHLTTSTTTAFGSPTAITSSDENHPDEHESNSATLARKALRYRKIYDQMDGVDVTDPRFNASQFLGVTWHKLVP